MNILVDADACPVKEIILEIAEKYSIHVTMFTDTSHIISYCNCETITVDKGHDSADFAMANRIQKGDIAVTQDYGLACMLMAKGSYVINQNGFLYTENNIDSLLMRRHVSSKLRRSGKKNKRINKISARTKEDNENFKSCLENLVLSLIAQ